MNKATFQNMLKKTRLSYFPSPQCLVNSAYETLKLSDKPQSFFIDNASLFVEKMRKQCWNDFLAIEKEFTKASLLALVDTAKINQYAPTEAITYYVEEYADNIYDLSLSNTQSRRARAGKEFEAIIEKLFLSANIRFDSQQNIAKDFFASKSLGKLVDIIIPNAAQYAQDKRKTLVLSAKTSLRERWQEVSDEMARTGMREMYLSTLDEGISETTRKLLYESNIVVVTTKAIKKAHYAHDVAVIDFEELMHSAKQFSQNAGNNA